MVRGYLADAAKHGVAIDASFEALAWNYAVEVLEPVVVRFPPAGALAMAGAPRSAPDLHSGSIRLSGVPGDHVKVESVCARA
jgi:hypothetical protein